MFFVSSGARRFSDQVCLEENLRKDPERERERELIANMSKPWPVSYFALDGGAVGKQYQFAIPFRVESALAGLRGYGRIDWSPFACN